MKMQRKVDLLGYIVVCGVLGWFLSATLPEGKLYLICSFAVFLISFIRAKLFSKIPNDERKTYNFNNLFWSTGLLFHPYSQAGITLFIFLASLFTQA